MTRAELIRLAERIAGDVQRTGLPPLIMLAEETAPGVFGHLDLYDGRTLELHGQLYSERDYEALIERTRSLLAGITARA